MFECERREKLAARKYAFSSTPQKRTHKVFKRGPIKDEKLFWAPKTPQKIAIIQRFLIIFLAQREPQ
jgi:hypothetical protein